MEVEEVELLAAEPLQALPDLDANPLGTAVDHLPSGRRARGVGLPVDAALSGDRDRVPSRRAEVGECCRDGPLALAVLAVAVGRVEVGDARIERGPDGCHGGGRRDALPRHAGDRPAPESERPDGHTG